MKCLKILLESFSFINKSSLPDFSTLVGVSKYLFAATTIGETTFMPPHVRVKINECHRLTTNAATACCVWPEDRGQHREFKTY